MLALRGQKESSISIHLFLQPGTDLSHGPVVYTETCYSILVKNLLSHKLHKCMCVGVAQQHSELH